MNTFTYLLVKSDMYIELQQQRITHTNTHIHNNYKSMFIIVSRMSSKLDESWLYKIRENDPI